MKDDKWFKKWGWIHRPISMMGYGIDTVAVFFLLTVFIAIDSNSHSVSDTLYGIFPYFVTTFLLIEWIAANKD